MAWTRMSEREVRRVEVLNEAQSGRRTVTAAASVLGISERRPYRHCWAATRRTVAAALLCPDVSRSSKML